MSSLIRLNKYISECGICSRRKADEHIHAGHIIVNNEKAEVGQKVDPEKDIVMFEGKKVICGAEDLVYYALNKPRGVISTASDEKARKSVTDLVPREPRVFPVGRLDKDSEGLMILTNDGELTQILTHPSGKHEKEYYVKGISQKGHEINMANLTKRFVNGISIEGKLMKADRVEEGHESPGFKHFSFNMTIHTGYNRQVRKMCDKIGLEVTKLRRIRIGKLKLESLNLLTGEYAIIKKEDII